MGYIKTQRFDRKFSFCPRHPQHSASSNHPSLQTPASEVGGAVCTRVVAGRWPRGRCALPGMDPVPMGQPDCLRAHGGRCRAPATVPSDAPAEPVLVEGGTGGVPCASGWSPGAGRAGAAPCPVWILCRWASQTTRARMVGGAASPQPVGCTHTCSCTEPCSCSCVRHRCSGRARQDGVKSWPLCANRKPGCRAIAARSVTTRQRGVHTLLHSAQPSESLAPCHTLA